MQLPPEEKGELLNTQSARCMNCGTPYCLNKTTGAGLGALEVGRSMHLGSAWLAERRPRPQARTLGTPTLRTRPPLLPPQAARWAT